MGTRGVRGAQGFTGGPARRLPCAESSPLDSPACGQGQRWWIHSFKEMDFPGSPGAHGLPATPIKDKNVHPLHF